MVRARPLHIVDVPERQEWERRDRHIPHALAPQGLNPYPCAHCPARCCQVWIRLTTVEALRLAFTLQIPLTELVEPMEMDDVARVSNAWPFRLDGGRCQLRLQQRNGRCLFCVDLAERHARCGVHALRPGVCRIFPFTVELGQRVIKVGDQRWCPVLWLQDRPLRARLRHDIAQWLEDRARDKAVVLRWNRRRKGDRGWAGFVSYLSDEVAPALGHDPLALQPLPKPRKLGKPLW